MNEQEHDDKVESAEFSASPDAETMDPSAGRTGGVTHQLRASRGITGDVSLAWEELEEEISGPASENRYAELGEIARGGMGAIVRIVDNDIRRPVAMKVVLGEDSRERLERFVEEAQVTGQLEHPNIVPVHELGLNSTGKVYFTMKLVKGRSLEEIIDSLADRDPVVSAEYSLSHLLQVFLKICDALAFAHAKGVIHRDVKPENVMVGRYGEVLVMDWGLAKVRGRTDLAKEEIVKTVRSELDGPENPAPQLANPDESKGLGRTMDGDVMGTPAYMPPEQAAGRVSEVDERSDVFALGGVLYKILTHEAPYEGTSVTEVLGKARTGQFVKPRLKSPWLNIPPELQSICLKAMQWKKEGRYGSVDELIEEVRAYQDHRPVRAHRYGLLSRFVRVVRRHPAGSMAGGVALVLLSIGAALMGMVLSHAQTVEARAEAQAARAEVESARAEMEKRRADDAVVEKRHALGRAVTAEEMLEKGRRVSAVLRGAKAELGETLLALKNSSCSEANLDETRKLARQVWPKVEAFESNLPKDPASRAAWLAAKGYLCFLSADLDGASGLFGEAREADPDVAYGWLFEAIIQLAEVILSQQFPPTLMNVNKVELGPQPPESDRARAARKRLESIMENVAQAPVWGESAAGEFMEILEGIRGLQKRVHEKAERGFSKALALPETAWIREEILLARGRARILAGDLDRAQEDLEKVLKDLPKSGLAAYDLGYIHFLRGLNLQCLGKDAVPEFRQSLDYYDYCVKIPRLVNDISIFAGRANTLMQLGLIATAYGSDPTDLYRKCIADHDRVLEIAPGRSASLSNRGTARRMMAYHVWMMGRDPGPLSDKALEDLTRALEVEPEDPSILGNRGKAYVDKAVFAEKKGEDPDPWLEKAMADFAAALEIHPGLSVVRMQRGQAMIRKGKWVLARGEDPTPYFQRAEKDVGLAVEAHPDFGLARSTRGELRIAMGKSDITRGLDPMPRFEEALEDLNKAVGTGSRFGSALDKRAGAYRDIADYEFRRGLDPRPSLEKAVADHSELLARNPEHTIIYNNRGGAWLTRSEYEIMRGMDPRASLGKAIEDFDEAIRLNPRSLLAWQNRGNSYWQMGKFLHQARVDPMAAYREATRSFQKAAEINPGSGYAYYGLGQVFARMAWLEWRTGRDPGTSFQSAFAGFEKALDLKSEGSIAFSGRGLLHIDYGNFKASRGDDPKPYYQKAIDDLGEALKLRPENPDLYCNRGNAYIARARYDQRQGRDPREEFGKAIAEYGKAIEKNPRHYGAHVNRGLSAMSVGDWDYEHGGDPTASFETALADYAFCLKVNPRTHRVLSNAAKMHMVLGERLEQAGKDPRKLYDMALTELDRATSMAPKAAWQAWTSKGALLEKLGRFDEAVEAYEHGLAVIGDRYPPLKERLSRARRKAKEAKAGKGEEDGK
ncbi:MAG: protein kinase domain-containing protein [Planctomycetota bacterium]|jgi:tetratricopeptide (TPR) repeat protein